MILILISWILLFLFASLSGIAIKNWLNLSSIKTFTLLHGLLFQSIFLSLSAFFYRINYEVFLLNISIQILLFLKYKTDFKIFIASFFDNFQNKQKLIFGLITILTVLKSTQLPSIFDNESYYIQTIKWLNEFGFVKGVANVHPFLAQFSFWHVLQSGFTFSFIHLNLNDLNGFVLLIGTYYFLKNSSKFSIINILFLLFYFQFIDSPSPDLPILIISAILFHHFIYNIDNENDTKSVWLLIIFMIFIKLTVLPLLFIGMYYWFKDKKSTFFKGFSSLIIGAIWVLKNIIITGYPFFPLAIFPSNFEWQIPIEHINYMYQNINNLGYSEQKSIHIDYSLLEKIKFWFQLKGINSIFNKGILIFFLLIPFTKIFKTKKFKILYFILGIHFIFLLLNSPQYRFFLPTFIFFGTILLIEFQDRFFYNLKPTIIVICSFCMVTSTLFLDIKNKTISFGLNPINIAIPKGNTTYENALFENKSEGNFNYTKPHLKSMYETSNGNLPCVNDKIFKFYQYIPQQRTSELKDGFYAKKHIEN